MEAGIAWTFDVKQLIDSWAKNKIFIYVQPALDTSAS